MKPVAVVFDLFGTLLDIASLQVAVARYTDAATAFVATWREKQIAYSFAATIMNRYEDFDEITARALRYAAARHGLGVDDRAWEVLDDEWRRVRAYDDALPALTQLRKCGLPCAVLTNGTLGTAQAALQSSGLLEAVDVTLSVDAVRTYKPAGRVYALATAHFATTADRLIFVTSNGWDATGAAQFGMRVAWCNRTQAPTETFGIPPNWTIRGLHELPSTADIDV